jgi:uncharacterized protein (TIRG00374 family)
MTSGKIFSSIRDLWRMPIVKVLTSFAILALLLTNLPLSDLYQTLMQVPTGLWVFVVAAFIVGHLVGAVKWRLYIDVGHYRMPFYFLVRCYFAGLFANLFLPSIAGGDVVRAGMAIRSYGEKENVIFGSFLDRFLDTSALGIIALIGAASSTASLSLDAQRILLVFLSLMAGLVLVLSLLLILPVRGILPEKLTHLIDRTRLTLRHFARYPHRVLAGLALSMLIQSGFVLLIALLGAACKIHLPLSIWFTTWPLAKLSAMLPVTLGGLGIREASLAILLAQFHVPLSSSVGLGLLWETVLIAGSVMAGGFLLFARGKVQFSDLSMFKSAVRNGSGEG